MEPSVVPNWLYRGEAPYSAGVGPNASLSSAGFTHLRTWLGRICLLLGGSVAVMYGVVKRVLGYSSSSDFRAEFSPTTTPK